MRNKFILIIITILFSLSISGCWDSVELRDREIITAIAIDKTNTHGKILLTLQSLIPNNLGTPVKSAADQKPSVHVVSTIGDSISDAFKPYREQISKSVYLQHNRIIVIGEDMAREGLTSILDFFLRYEESRSRALVLVCKGKASDILDWKSEESNIPSDYIVDLITAVNKISTPPRIDLHKLTISLFSKTTSPIITRLEIITQKNSYPNLKYSGSGVFDKDKLVGWLDVKETQAFLWITNQTNRGFIEAFFPKNQEKTICQRVTKLKTKINPELDNGNLTISLDINEEGSLIEKISKEEINSPDAIKAIEECFNEEIKKQIEACLRKVQKEYNVDVFGFGEAVHKKYPREWRHIEPNWKQKYPNTKVNINVNVKIRQTGLITNSFKD